MAGEKPTSRRDFLRGKSAGKALAQAASHLLDRAGGAMGQLTCGPPPNEPRLGYSSAHAKLSTSRIAMACEFAVEHHAADGPGTADAALEALNLVQRLENQLSIYRDHTEVSAINRTAAETIVGVEARLFDLLQLCSRLHADTGGAFDITSGPLSRVWGFLKREGRLPTDDEIAASMECVGFENVVLNPASRSIRFAKPGVEINFNSIGKGYALDRVAEFMAERCVDDYLCHGGRSSVLARGRDRAAGVPGWSIAVPHPLRPDDAVGEIVLRDEALGTSGSGTQYFLHEGRRFGHLIDPRTGWPSEGVHLATAVAKTAAEADALATAFYVLGPGGAAEYCAVHPEVGAVLVCPGPDDGPVDVHALNLGNRWLPSG